MAHREYIDSDRVAWQVWEVIPTSAERRRLRERRLTPRDSHERRKRHEARLRLSEGDSNGWLVFESITGKKRLRPIPKDWHLASVTELESMCTRAERASRPSQRLVE
ncbi:MAG: hypothetical protein M3Z05_10030 [Gemmatimonadota bacterium]|nr:hypothetical protein [Gemmatimonadota bacterium]